MSFHVLSGRNTEFTLKNKKLIIKKDDQCIRLDSVETEKLASIMSIKWNRVDEITPDSDENVLLYDLHYPKDIQCGSFVKNDDEPWDDPSWHLVDGSELDIDAFDFWAKLPNLPADKK